MSRARDPRPVVYLLRCGRDGSLYTGWTNDLARRLRAHEQGKAARYTRSRLPVELAAVIPMPDARAARREEARIKRLTRRAKLDLLEACDVVQTTSVSEVGPDETS